MAESRRLGATDPRRADTTRGGSDVAQVRGRYKVSHVRHLVHGPDESHRALHLTAGVPEGLSAGVVCPGATALRAQPDGHG